MKFVTSFGAHRVESFISVLQNSRWCKLYKYCNALIAHTEHLLNKLKLIQISQLHICYLSDYTMCICVCVLTITWSVFSIQMRQVYVMVLLFNWLISRRAVLFLKQHFKIIRILWLHISMYLCLIITIDRERSTLLVTVNTFRACVYFAANVGKLSYLSASISFQDG